MKRTRLVGLLMSLCLGLALLAGSAAHAQRRLSDARHKKEVVKKRRVTNTISHEQLTKLLQRFRHEPTISQVQRVAVQRAGVAPGTARKWLRRLRRSAWLPKIQLATSSRFNRDTSLDQEVGNPDLLRRGAVNQISYEIKLSWDLPRLIFDPNELKVNREAQRMAELRDQVVSQVTRLYFERRWLQIQRLLRPATTARTALRRQLRIAEMTAVLDALTGGLFRRRR